MPKRIQRKRISGWRLPENAKCVDRSTRWGNPFKVDNSIGMTLENCLCMYEATLRVQLAKQPNFLEPLRGKDLACFCKEGEPCHADILLRYANEEK